MTDFTTAEFSSLIETNLGSNFHICQLAYPLLKASGVGSVVFISSVSGFVSLKSMSVQGATKGNLPIQCCVTACFNKYGDVDELYQILKMFFCFWFIGAINQLTKNLACEWAKDNIRSNAVAPWYIRTSMVEQVIPFFLIL